MSQPRDGTSTITIAIACGVGALVLGAFDVAHRADWIIEVNPVGAEPSGATGDLVGRLGLLIGDLVLTAAATLAALAALHATREARSTIVVAIAAFAAIAHVALYALHWSRGFYYLLEPTVPKLVVGLALAQCLALGLAARRAPGATP